MYDTRNVPYKHYIPSFVGQNRYDLREMSTQWKVNLKPSTIKTHKTASHKMINSPL